MATTDAMDEWDTADPMDWTDADPRRRKVRKGRRPAVLDPRPATAQAELPLPRGPVRLQEVEARMDQVTIQVAQALPADRALALVQIAQRVLGDGATADAVGVETALVALLRLADRGLVSMQWDDDQWRYRWCGTERARALERAAAALGAGALAQERE